MSVMTSEILKFVVSSKIQKSKYPEKRHYSSNKKYSVLMNSTL